MWFTSHELRFPLINAPAVLVPILAPFGIASVRGTLFFDAAHAWGLTNFDHAEVGGYVATQWNLPDVVRDTALYHHGPLDKVANDPAVAIVHASDRLVNQAPSSSADQLLEILHDPAIETLGLKCPEGVVDFALKLVSSGEASGSWGDDPWEDEDRAA